MKKSLVIVLVGLIGFVSAQDVSDYSYISVPKKFSDYRENQYSLNNTLKILLKQRGYTPLGGDLTYWPDEAKLNPCRVLNADLENVSSFLTIKVELILRDCNGKKVFDRTESSTIKEFKEGYQDALQKITDQIKESNSIDDIVSPTTKKITIVEKTIRPNPNQAYIPQEARIQPETTIQISDEKSLFFENEKIKITALQNGEFIVINKNNSIVTAHFYPSKMAEVYHVKVNTPNGENYYTIGYIHIDGKVSYEQTNDFQTWSLIELN